MTAGPAVGVPWRSRTVQVVLLSSLLAPLGVPLVAPALPVIRDAFGVTAAAASLVVAAYFAVGIVLSPFIGIVADRAGRKRVLVVSLFGFAITGGAVLLAPSFGVLLALRALQGTAAAGLFITTVTLVGDTFDGPRRNAVLGTNFAVISTGSALFPVVGGALVAVAWNAPFVGYLLAVPVGLFAVRTLEEPAVASEARDVDYLVGALGSLRNRTAATVFGAAFATEVLTFGAVVTALTFLLAASFALPPVLVGLVITAALGASVVSSSQNGRLARRLSNAWLVTLGFACYGVGLVVAWSAATPVVVGLGAMVYGAGLGLSKPAVDATLGGLVPGAYRAGAFSLRNSTTFLGRTVGPIAFAGLAGVVGGYRPLLLVAGLAAVAIAAVAGATFLRRARPLGSPVARGLRFGLAWADVGRGAHR